MPAFAHTLRQHGLELTRDRTTVLQVNLGRLCNQACRHCHLEAGPASREVMDRRTVGQVVDYARRGGFACLDITGGAPELNPHLPELIQRAGALVSRTILRANLTALGQPEMAGLVALMVERRVTVMASFPSLNAEQAEAQRGRGVFARSLETLGRLNNLGYGREGSGLELGLVVNPAGSFGPPDQAATERRFRQVLEREGVSFAAFREDIRREMIIGQLQRIQQRSR